MKTVKQQADEYVAKGIPPDAPQIQKDEMRKAFYCGYLAAFMHMTYEVTKLHEQAAVFELTRIQSELHKLLDLTAPQPPASPN